ncbi:MAG: alpha-amylase family glycosyl hydrolase, partial [Sodaliphilus sp.]|nr:alpha-amylase family glycosyl hydrolase [Sodaliphilus sp.]
MNNKSKIIIYQLFPRLFTNTQPNPVFNGTIAQNGAGKMNQIDTRVLNSLRDLGVTHVWYTGIVQHASKTDYSAYGIHKSNPHVVKGNAGSPYAITDYYDVDPDIAVDVSQRMKEFEQLVQRTHACGMKVVLDFVPNHVARQYHSFAKPKGVEDLGQTDDKGMFFSPNNNFYYITGKSFSPSVDMGEGDDKYVEYPAKATGNDCFHECPGGNDWFETVKLNYGVDPWNGSKHFSPIPSTWTKMCDILLFWAAKGVDAFRCDMAHMVPVEFWHWAIAKVKEQYPDVVFIAELYDVGIYHSYIHYGGFDYLYDKVNLYDKLCAIVKNEESAASLTQCWQTVEGMQAHMLNFLENHDELRLAAPQQFGDAEL